MKRFILAAALVVSTIAHADTDPAVAAARQQAARDAQGVLAPDFIAWRNARDLAEFRQWRADAPKRYEAKRQACLSGLEPRERVLHGQVITVWVRWSLC
jgi:hypothetical protein